MLQYLMSRWDAFVSVIVIGRKQNRSATLMTVKGLSELHLIDHSLPNVRPSMLAAKLRHIP